LHKSCAALDNAVEYADHTVYDTTAIRQTAALYFRFMRGLSAMLYSETISDVDDPMIGGYDAFGRYVLAREAQEAGEERRVAAYLAQKDETDLWRLHFSAHAAMLHGEYAKAEQTLRHLLHAEAARSEVLLYCVFCDLEICCRELSDFRGAYEYSQNKVALLERMLREN